MDGIGNFISMMDYILDTKRKRHITGGILLSAAYRYDNSERGGRR